MTWKVYGRSWDPGELSDTSVYQTFTPGSNIILKAIRTWVICYNDPTFTSLTMKLYSRGPGVLIASSTTTFTKAQILETYGNGVKGLYFNFSHVPLVDSDSYDIVMSAVGYSPTSSAYLAWMQAYPDPVYQTGLTINRDMINRMPYFIESVIGASI